MLVLSSNVVGVGEDWLRLRNGGGADFQVFPVLVLRDALWGIKPPAKTAQKRLSRRLEVVLVSAERGLVAGVWAVSASSW